MFHTIPRRWIRCTQDVRTVCPFCGEKSQILSRDDEGAPLAVDLYCENKDCDVRISRQIALAGVVVVEPEAIGLLHPANQIPDD